MLILRILLFPFSILYGGILAVRNFLFNKEILPVTNFDVKIISVGNLSVGGTGKTPHVEFLIEKIADQFKTVILLRGYGRKTKGFLEVFSNENSQRVGDEALAFAQKYPNKIKVFVCEKRVDGVRVILQNHPSTELIILDDAFQHRYIYRDFNILLTEYNRPYFKDFVLPSGRLREFRSGKKRADCVIVTKSPVDLSNIQKGEFKKNLGVENENLIFFSSIIYGSLRPLNKTNSEKIKNIVLVTGIGNPIPLKEYLEQKYKVTHLQFKDHYEYTLADIEKIHNLFNTFASAEKIIVTTEKDAVRLKNSNLNEIIAQFPWYVQEMKVELDDEQTFLKEIYGNVRAN